MLAFRSLSRSIFPAIVALVMWPPSFTSVETEDQRVRRLEEEREAKSVSDAIDRAIEFERQEIQRRCPQTKVLFLGQAESGKSTLVNHFHLRFTPKAFRVHAKAWRSIIYLTLAQAAIAVLDLTAKSPTPSPSARGSPARPLRQSTTGDDLRHLRIRLAPLRQVEALLSKHFTQESGTPTTPTFERKAQWRASLPVFRGESGRNALSFPSPFEENEMSDARQIIEACGEDIVRLWTHPQVQDLMQVVDAAMEDYAKFFLDHAGRVASPQYIPSDEDILRVHLQTFGIQEFRISPESMKRGPEWVLYDSGSRGQRAAWAPYFDDVKMMIFTVSLGDLDIADPDLLNSISLMGPLDLWRQACGSQSLAQAHFVLVLNKVDLLEAKLDSRAMAHSIKSVVEDITRRFQEIHTKHSHHGRQLDVYTTCALDTKSISAVLDDIRDILLRNTAPIAEQSCY